MTAPPAVVAVEGKAGVGKTRLVSALAGHSQLAGILLPAGTSVRSANAPCSIAVLTVRELNLARLPVARRRVAWLRASAGC